MNFLLDFYNEGKNERFWARFQLKSKKHEEKFAPIKNPSIFGRLLNYEKNFSKKSSMVPPSEIWDFSRKFFWGEAIQ